MKTLQSNYTTPEQSKRLLELGLPVDSADMYYKQYSNAVVWVGEVEDVPQPKTYYIHEPELRHIYPEGTWTYKDGERIDLSGKIVELRKTDIPCWSVGRLMEIVDMCSVKQDYVGKFEFEMNKSYIQNLIYLIIGMLHTKDLDFSKLEK